MPGFVGIPLAIELSGSAEPRRAKSSTIGIQKDFHTRRRFMEPAQVRFPVALYGKVSPVMTAKTAPTELILAHG
jgi:hypothetical protein